MSLPEPRYPHFTNEPILVDWPSFLTTRHPWRFRPHLFHILQDHVAMSIERFYSCEQLAVIAAGNKDLSMGADGGLKDGKRARGHFMLLQLRDFIFAVKAEYQQLFPIAKEL